MLIWSMHVVCYNNYVIRVMPFTTIILEVTLGLDLVHGMHNTAAADLLATVSAGCRGFA